MDDGAESPEQMLGKYVTACFHDKSMTKEQKMEKLKTVFGKLLDDAASPRLPASECRAGASHHGSINSLAGRRAVA